MLDGTGDLDGVIIASPIHLHREMTETCLRENLYVLLEKPPVPLIGDLESLIGQDIGKRVSVGFQMIACPNVHEMKNRILAGAIGDVESIRIMACWPRDDTYYNRAGWAGRMTCEGQPVFDGPATNALAHLIHLAMFLASPDQAGFGVPEIVQGELYRARPIESYDVACLRCRFSSGIELTAALAHATDQLIPAEVEVIGSHGRVRLSSIQDGLNMALVLQGADGNISKVPASKSSLFSLLHRDFLAVVNRCKPRGYTCLSDTRGFVLTTNGMLLSSNEIRQIPATHVQVRESGYGRVFAVDGLSDLVRMSFRTGLLFSELKAPWASLSHPVAAGDITSPAMAPYFAPAFGFEGVHAIGKKG
jgi:predicted dehydrogenase